jgi:hypothetical protein
MDTILIARTANQRKVDTFHLDVVAVNWTKMTASLPASGSTMRGVKMDTTRRKAMSKKMNAGEAAVLMLDIERMLAPAWSNAPVLQAIHNHLANRLAALYHGKKPKAEKAVQP